MKKLSLIFLSVLLVFTLAACGKKCEHTYDNACDAICNQCEETREVGAHDFAAADCDTAKTCKNCGVTEGEALGHEWTTPDVDQCEVQSTCSRCGATEGQNKEHNWVNATCTTPKTCSVCQATEGEAHGHTPNEDDGDCETPITCKVCGDVTTPAKAHTPGEDDGDCTTAITCKDCGKVTTAAKQVLYIDGDDAEYIKGKRVLIVDDVRCGFRLDLAGSDHFFGFEADIICFCKALANGYNMSAICGKDFLKSAMSSLSYTGSYWLSAVPFAACIANINKMKALDTPKMFKEKGEKLVNGLVAAGKEHGFDLVVSGAPALFYLRIANDDSLLLHQDWVAECVNRGVFFTSHHNHFINASLTHEDINRTIEIAEDAFKAVKKLHPEKF